jgi:hypothetical protein
LTAAVLRRHCLTVADERVELPAVGEGLAGRTIGRMPGGHRLPVLGRVLVTVVVVAGLVAGALVTPTWGFIALGTAVGMLVVAGVPAALAGLMPAAALGRAALPLLLPLFVFVAAGVIKSPRELQFAVGLVTLLAAWFWLIKPDWERIRNRPRGGRRWRSGLRLVAQVGLPGLLVLAAVVFLGSSIVKLLGDSDQTARSLFVASIGCLAAAAVVRLLGYARTAFRALVALAIVLLLARLAVKVGVLPGGTVAEAVDSDLLALIAGGLLALTSVVEIIATLFAPTGNRLAALLEAPIVARWVTDAAAALGLVLCMLSAALLLCSVYAASDAGGAQEDRSRSAPAAEPSEALPQAPADLAAMFSPVLLFTEDQRWTPIAVDDYVRGATIRDWERRPDTVGGVGDLPTSCPGVVKVPCYVLTQDCPDGVDPARCAEELPDAKRVYVRVARKRAWEGCTPHELCADGSPDPFAAPEGPWAEQTETLIQYWYFYPYNEWLAPVAIGALKEVHASDWEAVTIGLSKTQPLWIAYSAHCGGSFADWRQITVSPTDPARLRPLVAVANGSQANYRVAKASRVPNFAECSGIPKDRLTLVSYAANIRDRTDDAIRWEPAASDLRVVDARDRPMSYPGRWAPFTRMTLENFRKDQRLGKDTGGPTTPTLQALWQTPMRTIFGGGPWKRS